MDTLVGLGFPDWLWMNDEVRKTTLNLARLIGEFDPSRRVEGAMFGSGRWRPGCKVCAVGAAFELLVDRNTLLTLEGGKPITRQHLLPAYRARFGDVDIPNFNAAISIMIGLNDREHLSFAEIQQKIEEAYNEYAAIG